ALASPLLDFPEPGLIPGKSAFVYHPELVVRNLAGDIVHTYSYANWEHYSPS
ncbi:unnamed protein product, partial [Amoebophrya sp. A120]